MMERKVISTLGMLLLFLISLPAQKIDRFTVFVKDPNGAGIDNAVVHLLGVNIRKGITNSDGEVVFTNVPAGNTKIVVEKFPQYQAVNNYEWNIYPTPEEQAITIQMKPVPEEKYIFYGHIQRSDSGKDIVGAEVRLSIGPNKPNPVQTNELGYYHIEVNKDDCKGYNDFQIEVRHPDHKNASKTGHFDKYDREKQPYPNDFILEKQPIGLRGAFYSVPVPGWGHYKVQEKKWPYHIATAGIYGLVAGGVLMQKLSNNTWEDYLNAEDPGEIKALKTKSDNQQGWSTRLFLTAGAAWLGNIAWVAGVGLKNQKKYGFHIEPLLLPADTGLAVSTRIRF